MKIAIIGPGAIGSTLAWYLSRAGHAVTVVARGARLAWLKENRAIVRRDGVRSSVSVEATLDTSIEWDLVLVTVLATQVDAVAPTLQLSRARRVMFMFNTFEELTPLRDAVGAERFCFGFPGGVFTILSDGMIDPQIRSGTTVNDPAIAELFSAAGIPTTVEHDMQSWLRTHAALVAPLMAMSVVVLARGSGVSWSEAARYARALLAGMQIVRAQNSRLLPAPVAFSGRPPRAVLTGLFWAFSRTRALRDLGKLGATEPRMLIDMMRTAAPEFADPLMTIRPE